MIEGQDGLLVPFPLKPNAFHKRGLIKSRKRPTDCSSNTGGGENRHVVLYSFITLGSRSHHLILINSVKLSDLNNILSQRLTWNNNPPPSGSPRPSGLYQCIQSRLTSTLF